jgi:hypothetical protein
MNFGKINKIMLFGGGQIIARFASILDKYELESLIITSNRHAQEIIDVLSSHVILTNRELSMRLQVKHWEFLPVLHGYLMLIL